MCTPLEDEAQIPKNQSSSCRRDKDIRALLIPSARKPVEKRGKSQNEQHRQRNEKSVPK